MKPSLFRSIITGLIYLLMSGIIFVFLFYYFIVLVPTISDALHISFSPSSLDSATDASDSVSIVIILDIITIVLGWFIYFRKIRKPAFIKYGGLLIGVSVLFGVFSWFYFPHFTPRIPCYGFGNKKTPFPVSEVINKFGQTTHKNPVFKSNNKYWEYRVFIDTCIFTVTPDGMVTEVLTLGPID